MDDGQKNRPGTMIRINTTNSTLQLGASSSITPTTTGREMETVTTRRKNNKVKYDSG